MPISDLEDCCKCHIAWSKAAQKLLVTICCVCILVSNKFNLTCVADQMPQLYISRSLSPPNPPSPPPYSHRLLVNRSVLFYRDVTLY